MQRIKAFLQEIHREEYLRLFPAYIFRISSYTARFIYLLDTIAQEEGKLVWIEKTPRHLHYIKQIERYVPEAKFIHIVRDGIDVISSLYQVTHKFPDKWGGARTIDACIDRWMGDIKITELNANKQNHFVISYKHLVVETNEALRRLCDFLSIQFEIDMNTAYKENLSQIVLKEEEWKKDNQHEIVFKSEEKARKIFSDDELTYIQSRIKGIDIGHLV
jgi:hypothetical protein